MQIAIVKNIVFFFYKTKVSYVLQIKEKKIVYQMRLAEEMIV